MYDKWASNHIRLWKLAKILQSLCCGWDEWKKKHFQTFLWTFGETWDVSWMENKHTTNFIQQETVFSESWNYWQVKPRIWSKSLNKYFRIIIEVTEATKEIHMKFELLGAPLEDLNLNTNILKLGKPVTLGTFNGLESDWKV